jgi:hypothetical protein
MSAVHLFDHHAGKHRAERPSLRARLAAALAAVWERLRAEWAEVAYVERELRGMLMESLPDTDPAPRRPVNGRYRGTQPRLTRPGPFTAVDMPTVSEPEPGPAWGDPGDGLGPDVPIVRPWSPEIAYGADRCQLDVAEAERHFALAMGPDGCEQT